MDSKELRSLMEAYSEVYAPQEEIDEEYESLDEGLRSAVKRLFGKKDKPAEEKPMSRGDQLRKKYNVGPEKSDTSAKRQILDRTRARKDRDEAKYGGSPYTKKVAQQSAAAHDRYLRGGYSKYGADDRRGSGNKARRRAAALKNEEFDVFDTVLEFLYVEGYVDTLEEAEWVMANLIDEEAVDIILGEALTGDRYKKVMKKPGGTAYSRKVSADPAKRATRGGRGSESDFGAGDRGSGNKAARRAGTYQEEEFAIDEGKSSRPRYPGGRGVLDQETRDEKREAHAEYRKGHTAGPGTVTKNPKKLRKQRAMGEFAKEAFESWLDEAMTNYEKNRKRAAQRAAARNAARDAGKTGVVPGVGYVTPRRERETWTDESGKTRHAKGL